MTVKETSHVDQCPHCGERFTVRIKTRVDAILKKVDVTVGIHDE